MQDDQDIPGIETSSLSEEAPQQETKPETTKEPKKKREAAPVQRELSPASKEALQAIEQLVNPEEKISRALEFMKGALAQSGNPRFKDFWDMRHHCLGLFKENLPAPVRSHLWSSYVELSSEARRLKEILDEQSAFASEQIELAIAALEKELEEYGTFTTQMKPEIFSGATSAIKEKRDYYEKLQGELNLLNTLASRINGLRKEIIKTEMRMRTKAKFFDKLSAAGDSIFPRRKELIKEISTQFLEDIKTFVSDEFNRGIEKSSQPLYVLREEIKILQGIAKVLTLNTQVFKETRELLSSCWDRVRESEKKKKEEFAQKRQASQQNADLVREKIALLTEHAKKEDANSADLHTEAKEIGNFMRTIDLDRESVFALKAEIKQVLQPFVDKERAEEEARLEKVRQAEQEKREKVLSLMNKAEELVAGAEEIEVAALMSSKAEIEQAFASTMASKTEKLRFEKMMKKLADMIVDKKEKNLLNLSSQDQAALHQLKEILKGRIEAREEIKKSLEANRKTFGGSGFDFEKAMMVREMMDSDKERLAKLNESIAEIEEKIAEIEEG